MIPLISDDKCKDLFQMTIASLYEKKKINFKTPIYGNGVKFWWMYPIKKILLGLYLLGLVIILFFQ